MKQNKNFFYIVRMVIVGITTASSLLIARIENRNERPPRGNYSREGRRYYREDRGGLLGGGGVLGTGVGRGRYRRGYYYDNNGQYYDDGQYYDNPGLIGGIVEGAEDVAEGAVETAGEVAAIPGEIVHPRGRYYDRRFAREYPERASEAPPSFNEEYEYIE